MDTAKDFIVRFHPVTDDTAVTMRTNRRKRVDGALETVKGVSLSAHDYFERFVIIVFANFTYRHTQFVRACRNDWRCSFAIRHEDCSIGSGHYMISKCAKTGCDAAAY